MKIKMLVVAVLIAFTTAACQDGRYGTKQTIGALGGAAAGGLAGARSAAAVANWRRPRPGRCSAP